jgi:hypothetical protein
MGESNLSFDPPNGRSIGDTAAATVLLAATDPTAVQRRTG